MKYYIGEQTLAIAESPDAEARILARGYTEVSIDEFIAAWSLNDALRLIEIAMEEIYTIRNYEGSRG